MPVVHERLSHAARAAGHSVRTWQDTWSENWPDLGQERVLFHGSLGVAARVAAEAPWRPGAFCDVDAFRCSTWYSRARPWLLHREWTVLSVQELVDDAQAAFARLGSPDRLFVRPDSPLKPFSGRVLGKDGIDLAALDHGFYYDDTSLSVVLAPVRSVEKEWRFVVSEQRVVAGSGYLAESRAALASTPDDAAWRFAAEVAAGLAPPEAVYVLDVCASEGELRLLELNPFSGADLYACPVDSIVAALA